MSRLTEWLNEPTGRSQPSNPAKLASLVILGGPLLALIAFGMSNVSWAGLRRVAVDTALPCVAVVLVVWAMFVVISWAMGDIYGTDEDNPQPPVDPDR